MKSLYSKFGSGVALLLLAGLASADQVYDYSINSPIAMSYGNTWFSGDPGPDSVFFGNFKVDYTTGSIVSMDLTAANVLLDSGETTYQFNTAGIAVNENSGLEYNNSPFYEFAVTDTTGSITLYLSYTYDANNPSSSYIIGYGDDYNCDAGCMNGGYDTSFSAPGNAGVGGGYYNLAATEQLSVSEVPEPQSLGLACAGLFALGATRKRKWR